MDTIDRILMIRALLEQTFAPAALEVSDEARQHVSHAHGGSGHFKVRIRSKIFDSLARIEAHRRIHEALGSMMDAEIHALSIEIL
ncbi:MAG: BolA family transcriptional regulator [Gammaproteobacteria bacterium]|nr:BolA family transcriptional regulator [Gammaproteobacteria bacterium]